jgi:hypothetical protein
LSRIPLESKKAAAPAPAPVKAAPAKKKPAKKKGRAK